MRAYGLWAVLAAAALARMAQFAAARGCDPFYRQAPPHFDMGVYLEWARSIAQGDILSSAFTKGEPFFYGPLYPYWLGGLLALTGSIDAAHIVQAVLGVGTVAVIWLMAYRLFGSLAAFAAGLIAALFGPLVFYEQTLLMEGLLTAVHAAMLLCLLQAQTAARRLPWVAAGGLLAGAACWGRASMLLAVLPLAVCIAAAPFLQSDRPADVTARRSVRRHALAAAALFLLLTAAMLLVTLWRNHHVSGRAVLVTSNGPYLLYVGNCHDSKGVLDLPASIDGLRQTYGPDNIPYVRVLLAGIAANPAGFVSLLLRKTWLFWNSYDVADNLSYYAYKRYSSVLRLTPSTWQLIVPLAAIGLWRTRRRWREQVMLYVYAVANAASIIMVFVVGRYRLQELIPLSIWAGAAVALLVEDARGRRVRTLVVQTLAVAAGVCLLWPSWSPAARDNSPPGMTGVRLVRLNEYINMAQGQMDLGRHGLAYDVLVNGLRDYPWAAALVSKMSDVCLALGRARDAVPVLERYVQLSGPNPQALHRLADMHMALGNPGMAADALGRLLQAHPDDARARARLATLQHR